MAVADQLPRQPWTGEGYKLWDFVTIGGKECPGLAVVKIKRSNKWDEKKSKGSHGGERNFSGADLAKGSITITMLTEEEFEKFKKDILPQIEPVPGKKKPDAVAIGSPILSVRSVAAVTIDDVDGPDTSGGKNVFTISFTEARAPEKKNASGLAGYGGTVPGRDCGVLKDQLTSLSATLQYEMANNAKLRLQRGAMVEGAQKDAVQNQILEGAGLQGNDDSAARSMLDQNAAAISASDGLIQRLNADMAEVGGKMGSLNCKSSPPSQNPKTVGEAP